MGKMPWLSSSMDQMFIYALIENAVLRVHRKKNSDIFPCKGFPSYVVNKMFIDVYVFILRNLPCPLKFLVVNLPIDFTPDK